MPPNARRTRGPSAVAAGAVTALTLAGCSAAGASQDGQIEPAAVATTIPQEQITLSLAYVSDPATERLINHFEAQHATISIETTKSSVADYADSINAMMTNDDAPDIVQFYPGFMRPLVQQGLIYDLDPYASAYDWDEVVPPSSLAAFSLNRTGKRLNSGSLYALPGGRSVVGVYYNKDLLQQAGANTSPHTLSEFAEAMSKVKESGTQPLSVGLLGTGGMQWWASLTSVSSDLGKYSDWVFGMPGSTIETDGARQATETLVDWVNSGFLSAEPTTVSDEAAVANFTAGNSAFLITSSRKTGRLADWMGDQVGFFLMPGASPHPAPVATGSATAFAISTKTDHPNAAAAFLNFLTSPQAARIQAGGGLLPVNTETDVQFHGLIADVATAYRSAIEGGGIAPPPHYATPSMRGILRGAVQRLVAGTVNDEDFLSELQTEWLNYQE